MSMHSPATDHRLIHIAGLPVNVYSSPSPPLPTPTPRKISIFFFLHGRESSAAVLQPHVDQIFKRVEINKRDHHEGTPRELIVVTFDQRNHGHRFVDPSSIGTWDEGNPNHAVDMYAMFVGTSKDLSYLIDFLPSYLFPSPPLPTIEWCVGGISLGGHATWWTLRHEPRVSLGISIIGSPSYTHLITTRAYTSTPPIPLTPPYFPPSFVVYLERTDAANVEYDKDKDGEWEWEEPESWRVMIGDGGGEGEGAGEESGENGEDTGKKGGKKAKGNPYIGRKILVLAGGDDTLVPWGSSREVVEGLNVGGGPSLSSSHVRGGSSSISHEGGVGADGEGGVGKDGEGGKVGGGEGGKVGGGEGGEGGEGDGGRRNKEGGVKKVIVYPGIGHEVTDEMIRETADFIWEWSLKP